METVPDLNQLVAGIQDKLNTALHSLTHQDINITLKESGIVPISKVHQSLIESGATTAVYIPIMGDVTGDIFLFVTADSALHVSDAMIGQEIGTTKLFTEFATSALKEMGNITTGVIVTEMANLLKLSMMLTIPNIATDAAAALVDQVLIEYGETANELLAIDLPFTVDAIKVSGSFLLLFDHPSSEVIAHKLHELNQSPPAENQA